MKCRCLPLLALTMPCRTAVCMCSPMVAFGRGWSQPSVQWLLLAWGTGMGGGKGCPVIPCGLSPGSQLSAVPWGVPQASWACEPPLALPCWIRLCTGSGESPASRQKDAYERAAPGATECSSGVLLFGLFLRVAGCCMCSLKAMGIHG